MNEANNFHNENITISQTKHLNINISSKTMEKNCSFCSLAFISLFVMASLFMSSAQNITTDQAALLALKAHITNDPSGIITNNWSATTSVCNWVGIICSVKHNRVTSLNFSYMGLTATFPPEMGSLSFLTYVTIKNNSFRDPLPIEFINLPRLKLLSIGNNYFSGEIPSWIGRLQRMKELYLYGNQFSGLIPTSLFNLTSLTMLNLQDNQLSGSIPREVGNLTLLEDLYLMSNQFTEIPTEIGTLQRLKTLDVEFNLFSGPIPLVIFNLSSLVVLGLSGNNFTGGLPDDICDELPSLGGLYLSYNQLSGQLPSMLWRCENLGDVSLSYNQFTGSLPRSVGNLTSVTRIFLGANYLEGEIPHELGYLQNLEYLALQQNFFNGTIPSTIFNLSKLSTIALVQNQLSGTFPSNLGVGLPNLVYVALGRNKLTGTIPESITNASKLNLFDVGENSFSGLIPIVFGRFENLQWLNLEFNNFTTESLPSERSIFSFLTNLTSLVRLELSHNPLNIFLPSSFVNFSSSFQYLSMVNTGMKGLIPKDIGNFLRSLTVLIMDHNQITGTIPTSIGKLKQLQGLQFSNNSLKGNIPTELCQLENLVELYLDNNKLYGAIPSCFDNLSALRTLSLGSNNFNSTMPSSLWSLSYILHLNLSSNSLTGPLPVEIGNLEVVLDIDVSKNQLSGEIPSSIGGLVNLVNLSLSHNELEGSIPDSLGDLVNLEILDLSSNNLTGVIPKSLEKLTNLVQFNVSFNHLEGEIPSGGPFSNFSAQSFISNSGLCAASSRLQVKPCTTNSSQGSGRKTNKLVYILPPILLAIFSLILLLLFLIYRRRKKEQLREDTPLPNQPTWRRTTYQELSQATEGFSDNNLIGRGNFGSVYKATLSDGTIAAVKIFNLLTQDANKSFELECEILCNIRHRNLVKIITSCSRVDFKALILEYMPNGNLDMWLYHHDYALNMLQRLNIMIDIALALDYLHNGYGKPIVHCDLKPSNILLDGDMVAHLTDFGISKLLGGGDSITQTMTLATVGYMAPELGLDGIVSRRGDVFSYGILLMETFTTKKPTDEMFCGGEMSLREWVAKSYPHSINNVVDPNLLKDDKIFNYSSECLSSIMLLALTCTAESPEKRASTKDVLNSLNKIKTTFLTYMQGDMF